MKRITGNHVNLFTWIIIIIQAFLITSLVSNSGTALEAIGWITGGLIPIAVIAYDQMQKRSLFFFLLTNRALSVLRDHVLSWDISVQLKCDTSEKVLEDISKKISSNYRGSDIKVITIDSRHQEIAVPSGPNFDITFNSIHSSPALELDNNQYPYIQVNIRNYRVGFRATENVLRHEVMPMLDIISTVVKPIDTDYTLVIKFDKISNPFFGLFLAKLRPQDIVSFLVKLEINDFGTRSLVTVTESKIYISSHSRDAISNLALEFLTYNPRLRERFRNA